MLAVDVSVFVVVVVVNGHRMGRRASCLVVIRQLVRSMCIRPHEHQDTYINHVRYICTLQLHVTVLRYSSTLQLYVADARYRCTLQLYVTAVRYSCTLQLYVTAVRYSCTLHMYVTDVRYRCTLQLYVTAVGYSCTLRLAFIVEIENKHNLNSNSFHINK